MQKHFFFFKKNLKRAFVLSVLSLILISTQRVMAQNQNTTVNGVIFNYPLSPYAASIDYSTNINAANCGTSPSDWINAIEFGLDNGAATITITLPAPSTSLTFLLGGLDMVNNETVTYISNNGGGSVALSTENAGAAGCFTLAGNVITAPDNGCNGKIVINASKEFTQVVLSITGPYAVISVVGSTVPVKLNYFTGMSGDCHATLNWQTGEELNFSNFEVLRSEDGISFKNIATVLPKSSNSVYKLQTDNTSTTYYKLKMNDIDGRYIYSNTLRLVSKCVPQARSLAPNPSREQVTILGWQQGDVVKIIDAIGKVVLKKDALETNVLNIAFLPAGVYTVKIFSGLNDPISLRLLKQ
ncbi:MAG: T9SS type A sorting domain-containing protein [Ferruginibacter sp.]